MERMDRWNMLFNIARNLPAKLEALDDAEMEMDRAEIMTFGIESVFCAGLEMHYVNTGDTYDTTICYTESEGVFVSSWGDWYEQAEQEYEEEEGVIRCSYCGEFTELTYPGEEWHETVCENCGWYVDGSGRAEPVFEEED